MTTVLWDLNVWFKEDYNVETRVTTWDDVLSINPAIYIREGEGTIMDEVRKVYTGIVYKCTPEETKAIVKHRSISEYGSDWFDFADELKALNTSKSVNDFIDSLGDPETIDASDNDDFYHIDTIEKLSGLRTLPTNNDG
jgi:hypothetical protein